MKPGDTARPSASTVRAAAPLILPISTILPSFTPTSPRNAGIPEPSTMRPLRINRSYVILVWPPHTGPPAATLPQIERECSTVGVGGETEGLPSLVAGADLRPDRLGGPRQSQAHDVLQHMPQIRGVPEDALLHAAIRVPGGKVCIE